MIRKVLGFYVEGFRGMSRLGRTLWCVILVKLAVMFLVLRVFFFRPSWVGWTIGSGPSGWVTS